jgi:hypothetical protein
VKKKLWANFTKNYRTFTQKIYIKLSKIGFGIRDPRSGKNLFRIPDLGIKNSPDPRSGSATLKKGTGILYISQGCGSIGSHPVFGIRIRIQEGKKDPEK